MPAAPPPPPAPAPDRGPRRWPVVSALGVVMIFTWGSTYYLMAVLAEPIRAETGWSRGLVMGALSLGLLVAALVSPAIGRVIGARGGRPVLAAGCALIATGLGLLALSAAPWHFLAGWAVIGLGMAAGLYDPAFATLGRLYGTAARGPITALTLWGGFASTVCWPLSALLLDTMGWRGTALAYAAIHLFGTLPLVLWLVPAAPPPLPPAAPPAGRRRRLPLEPPERALFGLFAAMLVLNGLATVILATYLFAFLQGRGVGLAEAVALGTLIGPAQVGARLLEAAGRSRHHPIWTLGVSVAAFGAGLSLLAAGLGPAGVALVLFGGGNGLFSIARGALPLALFGAPRYPAVMGALARPALIAQAGAPILGAALIGPVGTDGAMVLAAVLGLANLGLLAAIIRRLRRG